VQAGAPLQPNPGVRLLTKRTENMGKEKKWDKIKWMLIKRHLGYSDEEMELFKANPKNENVLDKGKDLLEKEIVIEVVGSKGCNSRHREGDRIYFDGAGNLLAERSPRRICIFALNAVTPLIYAATELFYAGVDPNGMKFKRASCIDVGVQCGGWGQIALEISMKDREGS
jgi:uncharacterized repeat protein (TIGR04076 family)